MFAERLERARKAAGLSMNALASKLAYPLTPLKSTNMARLCPLLQIYLSLQKR